MNVPVSALPSGTTPHGFVPSLRAVVDRHSARVKDMLRLGRSRTTVRQNDKYAIELSKKILSSDRSKGVEQFLTLLLDMARRKSPDAETVALYLVAIVRAENPTTDPVLSVEEAKIAESLCEGDCNVAEERMLIEKTLTARLAYLAASAKHREARRVLDAAVQREIAKAPA